jgi:N-carbamoyl-L-amino-acid hydrolase
MLTRASPLADLRIDGARLWASLMELAQIGATPKGGVRRIALTDLDAQGRDLFARWAGEAGMTVRVDPLGNMFARRAGADDALPPVGIGSHLDSQPSGGKFDGTYGVLSGLEVVRTLNDRGIRTRAPIEVCVWTNEEGSRFTPVMMGSGWWCGEFTTEAMYARADVDGVTVGEALRAIGYAGDAAPRMFGAYFEPHIEQGPVLEDADTLIGVVRGALGQRWFDVVLTGQDSHAGPTPMRLRRDAMAACAKITLEINRIANQYPDNARGTVGFVQVKPNSRNVVPGEVRMSIDLRSAEAATLDAMVADFRASAAAAAAEARCEIAIEQVVDFPPCHFAPECVEAVREAAASLGFGAMDIISGAGHDAVYVNRRAPAAMIFVPCKGGLSHNELESADPAHLAAGCDVLARAVLARAGMA